MPSRQRSVSAFYHCLESVTGTSAEFPDLVQTLTKVRRSEVVSWVCQLTAILDCPKVHDHGFQLQLAREMLPKELAAAAQSLPSTLDGSEGHFFHRRQLWFLLQVALLVCKESDSEISQEQVQSVIGHACLMVNDLLRQIESEQSGPVPEPDGALDWSLALSVSFVNLEWRQETVGRADLIWREIPSGARSGETALSDDLDAAFTGKYGITFSRFTHILLLFYCIVLRYAVKSPPAPFFVESPLMFGGHFSDGELAIALRLVASSPAEAVSRLLGATRHSWANDFTAFERRPLIEIVPGKYACPDVALLRRFFEHGVRELLADAYSPQRLKEIFGKIFETYVERLLSEVFPRSDVLANVFHRKARFDLRKTDQVCDGLLCWPRFVVLFEYKAGSLTSRQRLATRPEETVQAINQLLASDDDRKGVGQLVRSMRRLLDGEKVRTESEVLDLSEYEKLHPALVVYEEALGNHLVREHLNNRLQQALKRRKVDPARVGTFLLFTTRDIEVFERLAPQVGAESLLRDYANFIEQNPRVETGMFRVWAGMRFTDRRFGEGLVDRQSDAVITRLAEELRGVQRS